MARRGWSYSSSLIPWGTEEGRTKKNAVSAERADRRKAKRKHQRRGIRSAETSEPRASLGEELEAFKKVVRHTTRQDGDAEQAKWFHADTKPQYRRLKVMGIMEHQPAIAANCEVDPLTMNDIEDAIIAQQARCTAKQLKQYKDSRQKVEASGAFLIRKSKIDTRSCPKWKRPEREEEENQKEVNKNVCPFGFTPVSSVHQQADKLPCLQRTGGNCQDAAAHPPGLQVC